MGTFLETSLLIFRKGDSILAVGSPSEVLLLKSI